MESCNRAVFSVLLLFAGCGSDPSLAPEAESAQTLTPDGMVTLPATGFGDSGVTTSAPPAGWAAGSVAWCCTNWWIPIPVVAGDVVGSVAAQVKDVPPDPLYVPGSQGDGGSSVVLSLIAQTGATQTVLRSVGSNGSGNQQSLIMTLTSPYTVPAGTTMLVKANAFALWPSSVMHPSIVGPVVAAAPAAAVPPPTTHNVPLQMFTQFGWVNTLNSTPTLQTYIASSAAGAAYIWIPSQPGKVLSGVTLSAEAPSGGSFISIRVLKFFRDDTAAESIGALNPVPGPTAAWSDITIPTTSTPSGPDYDIALKLDAQTSGLRVKNIRATWQ